MANKESANLDHKAEANLFESSMNFAFVLFFFKKRMSQLLCLLTFDPFDQIK